MKKIVPFFLLVFVCCYGSYCSAQEASSPTLLSFHQQQIRHQQTAMLTLGGWAIVNIGSGLLLRQRASGVTREFHTMNALWNTVNLGIAGFGYYTALHSDPAAQTLTTVLADHQHFQRVLLFNAGLDIGYIMGGLYLTERARRPEVNQAQLKGFGNSIMLQGGFLLVFDLVNYFIAARHNGTLPLQLGPTSEGIGMTLIF